MERMSALYLTLMTEDAPQREHSLLYKDTCVTLP
jgi:hypothetical protein